MTTYDPPDESTYDPERSRLDNVRSVRAKVDLIRRIAEDEMYNYGTRALERIIELAKQADQEMQPWLPPRER